LVNNLYSSVGLIKVNAVGGYGETPSYYDCVFFGSNLSWASLIQDKYMNNIDWGASSTGLTYNKASIMATWADSDCESSSSHIVYPITSYGIYNEGGIDRTIQLLDTKFGTGTTSCSTCLGYYGFHSSGNDYGTPLPSADWRPSVFVKNTLEKIFSNIGYNINSTFMDTDMFKKLVWLLPNFKYNNPDERYENFAVESNFTNGVSMSATGSGFPVITEDGIQMFYEGALEEDDGNYFWDGAGRELLEIDVATNLNVTLDEGSYVDSTTHYITIGEYGYYDINLSGIQSKVARAYKGGADLVKLDQIDARINLEIQTVGETSWIIINSSEYDHNTNQNVNQNIDTSTSYQDMPSINEQGRWLNKGDKIRLTLGARLWCDQRDWQEFLVWIFFKSGTSSKLDVVFKPEIVEYGQTYDLDKVMNSDYKQVDFIKGIAHAFNLQMTTDESTKTVSIEPFNSFYKSFGSAIDWTYKLDRSKEISDKWLENDLKRTLVFKYKSDSNDAKVKDRGEKYFKGIEDEFPYREILPDTFEKGQSTFENPFFAGSYNAKDLTSSGSSNQSNDPPFSACLWTEDVSSNDSTRPPKGYEFLPRLLYWNKYSPAAAFASGIATPKRGQVQTWTSVSKSIVADSTANIGVLSNVYPQATMINADNKTSPVLSYGNAWVRDYNDATEVYTSKVVGKGLYDTYYKDSIEMLKENPRMRTSYITLKISDIVNLDFTKLVYIDGVYWRINKIIDFMPNKNESTKVELIQFTQQSAVSGSTPMVNSSGAVSSWQSEDSIANDFNFGA